MRNAEVCNEWMERPSSADCTHTGQVHKEEEEKSGMTGFREETEKTETRKNT